MKKFKFSLEPVLDQRERIEEEKQIAFAARRRELQTAQAELDRLDALFRENSSRLRRDHKGFSADELRAHYAHLEYLDRAITMQHGVVSQCRFAVDRGRLDLLEAGKDRKVIEKLKERRLEEHRQLAAAQEQKDLDDFNNRRFARNAS